MNELDSTSNRSMALYTVGALLAVIGIILSLYATFHHIDVKNSGVTDAACNINQTFNCDDVANSKYSEILGFPMGILGIGFFGGMLLLLGTSFFKEEFEADNLITYTLLSYLGALISIGLLLLSWFSIGVICPTCVGVYVTCFAQAGLVFILRGQVPGTASLKAFGNGATYPVAALAAAAISYSFLKPTPSNFTRDDPQIELARKALENQPLDFTSHNIPLSKSAYAGLGEDYRLGKDDAKVVIQEFADFQCGACKQASASLKKLREEFGTQILIVFRNFPLDSSCNKNIQRKFHESACDAAIIARCAGRKGQFWPMHDQIFANQSRLSATNLTTWAKSRGLSDAEIKECRNSKDILAKIKEDIDIGERIGVTGTPAIFINGRKVVGGRDIDTLRSIVLEQLSE